MSFYLAGDSGAPSWKMGLLFLMVTNRQLDTKAHALCAAEETEGSLLKPAKWTLIERLVTFVLLIFPSIFFWKKVFISRASCGRPDSRNAERSSSSTPKSILGSTAHAPCAGRSDNYRRLKPHGLSRRDIARRPLSSQTLSKEGYVVLYLYLVWIYLWHQINYCHFYDSLSLW